MITEDQISIARKSLELLELEFNKQNGKGDYSWGNSFKGEGFKINNNSAIEHEKTLTPSLLNTAVFKTEKQAKSALAMAQLSHIIAEANGDWDNYTNKHVLSRVGDVVANTWYNMSYHFLAFKSAEIRDEVYAQNKQLIHDYLMIP
jgi:hypothetical protein